MSNPFPVSENVSRMNSSSTLKAGQIAANLREEGHDVIDLTVGEPDFDTPEFIKQYAWEGLQKGLTKYVVIDDDLSINGLPNSIKEKCVLTKPLIGLDEEAMYKVMSILKGT